MAIFHFSIDNVSRSKGQSVIAKSAYQNAQKMTDERTGDIKNYTNKQGVIGGSCFVLSDDKKTKVEIEPSKLWNAVEKSETQKNSRTGKQIVMNLPHELTTESRKDLVDDFTRQVAEKYDCAVDYAIHLPDEQGDQRNHHAHVMLTTRKTKLLDGEIRLTDKTDFELSNSKLKKLGLPSTIKQTTSLRKLWADTANKHLETNNIDVRIDHRSLKEQGKNQIPTVKMGFKANDMERNGIETEKGNINRDIEARNERIKVLESDIKVDKFKMKFDKTEEKKEEKEVKTDSFMERMRKQHEEKQVAQPTPNPKITNPVEPPPPLPHKVEVRTPK